MNARDRHRVTPLHGDAPIHAPLINSEAEQALLGAIFRNHLALDRVIDFLKPEHFGFAVHGRIFAAITTLFEKGQSPTPVALKNLFDRDDALTEIGGAQYLTKLAESAVTILNAEDYGRRIYDLHLRRNLVTISEDMAIDARAMSLDDDAAAQIERIEAKLADIGASDETVTSMTIGEAAYQALKHAQTAFQSSGTLRGMSTGLAQLDDKLSGFAPTDLTIIGSRPGMGKTGLALGFALYAAETEEKRVLFAELEMSAEQLGARALGQLTAIPASDQARGRFKRHEFDELYNASERLKKLPLEILAQPVLSISALARHARRMKRRGGLDLILVDYLQLMAASERNDRDYRREADISAISRGLKKLAMQLGVSVVALSQLTRKLEDREDKRPQLNDLRESGAIEQDADNVLFIFREEYYLKLAKPIRRARQTDDGFNSDMEDYYRRLSRSKGKADLILAKSRHGPTGVARVDFHEERTQFLDASDQGALLV